MFIVIDLFWYLSKRNRDVIACSSSIPIIASASGSLKPVELQVSFHPKREEVVTRTRQVQKVGILVELVEYGARAVLHVRSRKDSDGAFRKGFCKLRPSIVVFLRGYTRSYCISISPSLEKKGSNGRTFPRLQQMRMGLMQRLSEVQFRCRHTQWPSEGETPPS